MLTVEGIEEFDRRLERLELIVKESLIDKSPENRPNPCPFCRRSMAVLVNPHGEWRVCCEFCESLGPLGSTKEVAVERWDRASK